MNDTATMATEELRRVALEKALEYHRLSEGSPDDVIATARIFEIYLKG
jgi:hypothetical protein